MGVPVRLRQECEHGQYDDHAVFADPPIGYDSQGRSELIVVTRCPGGEFLAEDTLVIERTDDPMELVRRLIELGMEVHDCVKYANSHLVIRASDNATLKCEWVPPPFTVVDSESWVTDALAVREGEG